MHGSIIFLCIYAAVVAICQDIVDKSSSLNSESASQARSIRAGSNGIDIEVSLHHTVSVSNFQSIKFRLDSSVISIPIPISSIEFSMPRLPNIIRKS